MTSTFSPVTHVIFDMDGLLLDTERLYTEATQNIASRYGKKYTWNLKVKCMGLKGDKAAELIINELQLPLSVPQYLELTSKQYEEIFPKTVLLPGADKLVRHLHHHGIPIAIATGGNKASFDLKTMNHKEYFSLFSHVVFASTDPEVGSGKPAPDVFLVCARRFPDNPAPSKCLVFEDSPNGMQGGVAADMQVVMVPDQRLQKSLMEGSVQVLNSLEEFEPELFGLPKFCIQK